MTAAPHPSTPQPLVSIGLPVFNGARWLGEALDSLCGQSYRNLEIIVSDNHSDDATPEICARYAAADPRIRYLRQEHNRGAAENHRVVLHEARGEYFMFATCDDRWSPDWVARLVAEITEEDAGVMGRLAIEFQFEDRDNPPPMGRLLPPYRRGEYARFFLTPQSSLKAHYTYSLFHRERYLESGTAMFDAPLGGDHIIVLSMLKYGGFRSIDGPTFHYRVHSHSLGAQQTASLNRLFRALFAVYPWGFYRHNIAVVPGWHKLVIAALIPLRHLTEQLALYRRQLLRLLRLLRRPPRRRPRSRSEP